ncbi:MAG: hypothetical protein AAB322_03985, partial [Pseudomonadota bacterium]
MEPMPWRGFKQTTQSQCACPILNLSAAASGRKYNGRPFFNPLGQLIRQIPADALGMNFAQAAVIQPLEVRARE